MAATTTRRVVVGVVVVGSTVVGVRGIAALTQSKADDPELGSRTEVVLEVETRDDYDLEFAAEGLWATCRETVSSYSLESFEALDDGRFSFVVSPGLGESAEKRLVGCLQDLTVNRTVGDVIEVREL